jgi:hypothetical protein
VQFNLTDFSYIYMVLDSANAMPNNDNNANYDWQLMPDTFTLNGRTMKIYRSRIMQPHEIGYFADNGYENSPFDPNSNMYLVFVTNLEQQVVKSTDAVTASSVQSPNLAPLAIDGNTTTRWAATSGTLPQTFEITLDQPYAIGGYDIDWYDTGARYYQYKIQVSNDNSTWYTSLDNTANTNEAEAQYRVPSTGSYVGKYVLITITGASAGYASINEIKINGIPASEIVPAIYSPNAVTGNMGTTFNYQVAATESPTVYTATGLPAGLSISPTTGTITGNATQSGTFAVTITATNAAGTSSSMVTITIDNVPQLTPSDTPTLPQWALIVMSALLVGFGWRSLAERRVSLS